MNKADRFTTCCSVPQAGVYDPRRVLGVTTLDVVRAAAFIGEINGVDPRSVTIPVIGGHSGVTIIPLLSQSQPAVKLSDQAKIKALTERVQEAGTEVRLSWWFSGAIKFPVWEEICADLREVFLLNMPQILIKEKFTAGQGFSHFFTLLKLTGLLLRHSVCNSKWPFLKFFYPAGLEPVSITKPRANTLPIQLTDRVNSIVFSFT